jgi:hypothetical protein
MTKRIIALTALVAAVLMFALPAMGYPLTIAGAARQAYGPGHVKITTSCKKDFGRHLYALVAVKLPNGKASTLALQFINTAGWFAMWKDNKVQSGVPASERAAVRSAVSTLQARCA